MGTTTKQQNKVPELHFSKAFWLRCALGDMNVSVSDGNYGEMYPKANQMVDSGIPFIRANNIKKGTVVWDDMRYIPESLHQILTSGHLRTRDILVTTRGEIGMLAYVPDDFDNANINAQICLLRCGADLSSLYLFYFLSTSDAQKQFQQLQTGSALKQLPKGNLAKVQVSFPEIGEQQKIGDFLGSVDAWLDNLRQQKTALETYKRGMMQKLFTQQVRFKDDNGKDFPEWITAKLGDLGEVKTSSVDKLSNKEEVKVNLLNYMDVYRRDHIYNTDEFQSVTATDRERISFNLKQGDILFTPSSETPTDIGHSAVVMEDLDNVLYSYHLLRFRPKAGVFVGGFGGYAFKSFNFYKELWRRAQGATRYTLSLESMKDAEVTYPASTDEQKKIADFLTSIDQAITVKSKEIAKAKQWKKGLMQKMFV